MGSLTTKLELLSSSSEKTFSDKLMLEKELASVQAAKNSAQVTDLEAEVAKLKAANKVLAKRVQKQTAARFHLAAVATKRQNDIMSRLSSPRKPRSKKLSKNSKQLSAWKKSKASRMNRKPLLKRSKTCGGTATNTKPLLKRSKTGTATNKKPLKRSRTCG